MTDIQYILALNKDEAAGSRDLRVTELWAHIGRKGVKQVADELHLGFEELINVMAAQAIYEIEAKGTRGSQLERNLSHLGRNWLEISIGVLGLLILLLLVRALIIHDKVVVSVGQLPALHMISEEDVRWKQVQGAELETMNSVKDVVGRYTLQVIEAETPLQPSQLSSFRRSHPYSVDLTGRYIMSIPISVASLPLAVPGSKVSLLFAPRGEEESVSPPPLQDVVLLETKREGNIAWIIIAVKDNDLEILSRYVGRADILVLQPG
jgi:hypothetical protein